MKKVKKKLNLTISLEKIEEFGQGFDGNYVQREYTYIISTHEPIENINTIEFYVEVDEPETLKEWLKENELEKKDLVEWLNKRYVK